MEPVARHGARALRPRRTCSPATSTRRAALFAEASALAAAHRQHRHARRQRGRARAVGDGSRAMGGGGRARRAGARRHRRAPDARLRHQRARLRRRGPARRAPRRPEGGGPPAHAGDASPSVLHVRAAVPRRAGAAAAGQGVLGHRRPRRPLATCCARSTTSCSTGRRSAPSSTRSSEFRELVTSSAPSGSDRRRRRSRPAELRLLPYLQTHLTIREIGERLFVSRNTVSSEVGSIYRKLGVSSRSDAVQQATAIGLLGG